MPFIVRMGANAIAILLIAYLLPSVMSADGPLAALAAAFVLGMVNAVIRPLFVLLTLPVTVVTLGSFREHRRHLFRRGEGGNRLVHPGPDVRGAVPRRLRDVPGRSRERNEELPALSRPVDLDRFRPLHARPPGPFGSFAQDRPGRVPRTDLRHLRNGRPAGGDASRLRPHPGKGGGVADPESLARGQAGRPAALHRGGAPGGPPPAEGRFLRAGHPTRGGGHRPVPGRRRLARNLGKVPHGPGRRQ